jgi:hypothetical protein
MVPMDGEHGQANLVVWVFIVHLEKSENHNLFIRLGHS